MPTTPTKTDAAGTGAPLERAFAFERAMHAAAGRTVTAAWGQAFLSPEIDRCYDRNLLWAVGDAGGLSAARLDAQAERLLGGEGMAHRRLLLEPAAEARLREELVALGYDAGRHVFQVHAGAAAGVLPDAVAGVDVREVSVQAVLDATERYLRTDPDTPYGRDARTRRHLIEHHRTYGPAGADERRFAVCDGDAVVAWARLWTRGAEAQVEDVVCLVEHRGRGYGRAVVTAATRAALAGDPQLLFIVADAGDWPKELYARLGYETAGALGVYLRFARMPQTSGPGAA
ncbi:MAG: family N-acetyltransferase [Conexibacter sp.]|nr:family N-acetyltransferase [Conexibacter sp.]